MADVSEVPAIDEQGTTASSGPATVSSRRSATAPSSGNKPDKVRRGKLLLVAFALMLSLATGFLGGWLGSSSRENANSLSGSSLSNQQRIVASESRLIASIAKNVGPSVVSINVVSQSAAAEPDFFGFSAPPRAQEAAGTGVLLSTDGLILTNRHVIPAGQSDISVTLSDGTEFDDVKVVGRTNENDSLDIAFLKISDTKGHPITPAEIGDSSKVQVGDVVVAIGNALGQFSNTVTSGIISGFGRSVQAGGSGGEVENLNDLFQTDAAINQGNSGGPLVNMTGQVIGINTAVAGSGQNIGFAIPINDVNGLIKQVLKSGRFDRSYLGVRYIPLTNSTAKELKISTAQGAYVAPAVEGGPPSIIPDSPADKAGLREKDIITEVDGTKIDSTHSLSSLVGRKSVGEKVSLKVIRDGKTVNLTATVGAAPTS